MFGVNFDLGNYQETSWRDGLSNGFSTEKTTTQRAVRYNRNAKLPIKRKGHKAPSWSNGEPDAIKSNQLQEMCGPYLHRGTIPSSMSRVQRDHSICTAVIGWTAWARLMVSGLASDRPIYLTFPSSTSFFSPFIYSSNKHFHQAVDRHKQSVILCKSFDANLNNYS